MGKSGTAGIQLTHTSSPHLMNSTVHRSDCSNPEQCPASVLRELKVLKAHAKVDAVPYRSVTPAESIAAAGGRQI